MKKNYAHMQKRYEIFTRLVMKSNFYNSQSFKNKRKVIIRTVYKSYKLSSNTLNLCICD